MNFQTLTAGQHTVTLPAIASEGFDAYGADLDVKLDWLDSNTATEWHLFLYNGDDLLDFFHAYYGDGSGAHTPHDVYGEAAYNWLSHIVGDAELKFVFADASDAMLFKLTWGGQ